MNAEQILFVGAVSIDYNGRAHTRMDKCCSFFHCSIKIDEIGAVVRCADINGFRNTLF